VAFTAAHPLLAEALAEGTLHCCGVPGSSRATVQPQGLTRTVQPRLLAGQKDTKGTAAKAVAHTAAAVSSVIEKVVPSPVVLGSKVRWDFPLVCTISPKLGGSANLPS